MNQPVVVYLILSLMFLVISVVFIFFIVFHNKKMLEHTNRLAQMEIAKSKQDLKDSIAIQEMERSKIGADLHDDLGPTLSAVKLKINSISTGNTLREADWVQIRSMIDQTIYNVRTLSHTLYPNTLKEFGLVDAVREMIARIAGLTNVAFIANIDPSANKLEYPVQLSLYRIIQEFINNSLKHSHCTEIHIQLLSGPGEIAMDLSDNGKGFAGDPDKHEGLGLKNMRMRAEAINAAFQLESKKDKGTSLKITRNLSVT